jgi:hypothetical protein
MRRAATALAAVSIALPSLSGDAFAHALAQRYDLPLPLGYFLMAAGAAVTVSFAILALYWRHDPEPKQSTDHVALRGTIPASIVATLQFFSSVPW